jgi:hypothetical protein
MIKYNLKITPIFYEIMIKVFMLFIKIKTIFHNTFMVHIAKINYVSHLLFDIQW